MVSFACFVDVKCLTLCIWHPAHRMSHWCASVSGPAIEAFVCGCPGGESRAGEADRHREGAGRGAQLVLAMLFVQTILDV